MKTSLSAVIYLWSMYPMLLAFQGESKIFSPLGGTNKRLVHSFMMSMDTASLDRCLDSCMYRTNCLSIKFVLATNHCELITVSASSYPEGMDESKPGYLHVDLSEWLEVTHLSILKWHTDGYEQFHEKTNIMDSAYCIDLDQPVQYAQTNLDRHIPSQVNKEKSCEEVFLVSGPHGVPDNQMTASSVEKDMASAQPHRARLNSKTKWDPAIQKNSFIQVEFNKLEMVRGVVTKGSGNSNYWVTTYKIAVSKDCVKFQFPWRSNVTKIFDGNTDSNTAVTNYFQENIPARCLTVYPLKSNGYITLRFDVIGFLLE